jgi:hypothetical protein
MPGFEFMQFGITMGQLVAQYRSTYAWLAALPHIAILVLFYLILRHGNRYGRAYTIYNIVSYIWLLIFVGGWFSVKLYQQLGPIGLGLYIATPILLVVILYQWIQDLRNPRLDLDLSHVSAWRWAIVIPILVWGYWYPPYEWGVRLIFAPRELLFGAYGLMGCPTTMVALAILFLKYPAGNRPLFYALATFATVIGLAMVATGYIPDIPLLFIGLSSLALILLSRRMSGEKIDDTAKSLAT